MTAEQVTGRLNEQRKTIFMRIAVVSDIHSNLEAFTAVMEDISKLSIDDIISLGAALSMACRRIALKDIFLMNQD